MGLWEVVSSNSQEPKKAGSLCMMFGLLLLKV